MLDSKEFISNCWLVQVQWRTRRDPLRSSHQGWMSMKGIACSLGLCEEIMGAVSL